MKLPSLDRILRRKVLDVLATVRGGEVQVIEGDQRLSFGDGSADESLRTTIVVRDPRFWRAAALGGSAGAGGAYVDGLWECSDLVALSRILARNEVANRSAEGGFARLGGLVAATVHALRRNSRHGSRRNIRAHYDVGNDFFGLMLDESLTYSCGIFEDATSSLADASRAKNDRVCRKLELGPDDHLLEIGTGWGGFAIHAATHYGCRVTTTTISREQHDLAARRIRDAGVDDRVTLLLQDYRDLDGRYDKLVSIEMIEAVGHHYYDAFFETCSRLLAPDGRMLLQAIVITDRHYDVARRGVDFIKKFVFPGCCIPSVSVLATASARATDMRPVSLEDITPHYVRTLRCWRDNVHASIDEIRALGYPERFLRLWDFYLAYCEGGFAERYIGDVQMLFAKPLCRPNGIPASVAAAATPALMEEVGA